MVVELFGYSNLNEQKVIHEAASAGLKSMDHLIRAVNEQCRSQQIDCREIADFTVSKFRKVISMLNRTGHARFRRAPVRSELIPSPQRNHVSGLFPQPVDLCLFTDSGSTTPAAADPRLAFEFTKSSAVMHGGGGKDASGVMIKEGFGMSAALSTSGNSSSTFLSSITGEGSVTNAKGGLASMFLDSSAPAGSAGKPPLSRKRCSEHSQCDSISGKTSKSSRCHCKKRKSKVKTTIRVPAISLKLADIPPDEYSWRKYGQKPIKGSPYPRGYYKCSTVRGCPARKHVERATDDPKMMIVTYEGEHRHALQENTAPGTAQLVVFESSR